MQKDDQDPRVDKRTSSPLPATTASADLPDATDRPDDDDARYPGEPWCEDFEGHAKAHEFCVDHQASWCLVCDRCCPECIHDPHCRYCHCALNEENHDWDCAYAGDDDDDG